jgi:hypothetical protein
MKITNFSARKLDDSNGELSLAKQKWQTNDFIMTDDLWVATFEIDGLKRYAGIRRGRRADVAPGTNQVDIFLRVNEEEFDADKFISEADAADIIRLVTPEFLNGGYC